MDVEPAQARLLEGPGEAREQDGVRGHGHVADALESGDAGHDLHDVRAEGRLAPGEAELAEPQGQGRLRHRLDLDRGEELGRGNEAQPAQGHAVDAPQVAVVDDRDAEIVDLTSEAVFGHRRAPRGHQGPVYSTLTSTPEVPTLASTGIMKVRVRLFAALREAMGRAEVELELADGATAEDAWARLVLESPGLALKRRSLSASVNRRYARVRRPPRRGRRGRLHSPGERRMSGPPDERRKHPRSPTRFPLYVAIQGELYHKMVTVEATDISAGGLAFETKTPLPKRRQDHGDAGQARGASRHGPHRGPGDAHAGPFPAPIPFPWACASRSSWTSRPRSCSRWSPAPAEEGVPAQLRLSL